MHPLLASTALGLVAAWPVGALGFGLGRLVERLTDDPRPRAAAWSLAYALPAGALVATVALTFSPLTAPGPAIVSEPVRVAVTELTGTPVAAAPAQAPGSLVAATPPGWTPEGELATNLAWSLAGLSVAGLLARGWRWNRGRRRLAAIRVQAEPCDDATLLDAVHRRARRLGVATPDVRVSLEITEPLLAGARRPTILLPKVLADSADASRLALVCGHELAHLKRGDNWRIPAEEALAGLFWLTPPVSALRGRMLAAREAVCDLTALDGAAPEARQDYARVLVEALKANALPAPQSAFTGRERNLIAARLMAILQPRGDASKGRVGLALALGGLLTVATGAGSLALADQARKLAPAHVQADAAPRTAQEAAQAAGIAQAEAVAQAKAVVSAEAVGRVAAAAQAEAAAQAVVAARAAHAEAAQAAEVAEVAQAAQVAAVAEVAEVARVAAMARPSPSPHPDPRPSPHPTPMPDPSPKGAFEIMAEMQRSTPSRREVVFQGGVKVKGKLDPVLVDLKVNGQPAVRWFQPSDLPDGAIQRLEVKDLRVDLKGKIVVNVVMDGVAP